MLDFLRYLVGSGGDDVTVYDQAAAQTWLEGMDPTEPDDMAIAAVNRGNRAQFIQLLAQRGVWVIVRLDQGEFEGDIRLLEYEEGERSVLPVFSSLWEAVAFVHTVDLSEMVPLQYMQVTAAVLTHNDLDGYKIIMNPFAGAMTEIQDPDLQALRLAMQEL